MVCLLKKLNERNPFQTIPVLKRSWLSLHEFRDPQASSLIYIC